jgi:hypothetical protein
MGCGYQYGCPIAPSVRTGRPVGLRRAALTVHLSYGNNTTLDASSMLRARSGGNMLLKCLRPIPRERSEVEVHGRQL